MDEISSQEFEEDPEEAAARGDADPELELTEEDELFLRPLSKTREPTSIWRPLPMQRSFHLPAHLLHISTQSRWQSSIPVCQGGASSHMASSRMR